MASSSDAASVKVESTADTICPETVDAPENCKYVPREIADFMVYIDESNADRLDSPKVITCDGRLLNKRISHYCAYCNTKHGRRFWSTWSVDLRLFSEHCRKEHGDQAAKQYGCGRCYSYFATPADYEQHLLMRPRNGYWCRKCDFVASTRYYMLDHVYLEHPESLPAKWRFERQNYFCVNHRQLPPELRLSKPLEGNEQRRMEHGMKKDLKLAESCPTFKDPLRCPQCHKRFSSRPKLRTHRTRTKCATDATAKEGTSAALIATAAVSSPISHPAPSTSGRQDSGEENGRDCKDSKLGTGEGQKSCEILSASAAPKQIKIECEESVAELHLPGSTDTAVICARDIVIDVQTLKDEKPEL